MVLISQVNLATRVYKTIQTYEHAHEVQIT